MKKIFLIICCLFFICGCSKNNGKEYIGFQSKYNDMYYEYYSKEKETVRKENNFKVELLNKENNHEQIILKNQNSVYVLTPSLNKSFKFQSDWPYNNSQIYLLQPILNDIENDKNIKFETKENGYIITSNVNYSNESDYKKQRVYFDKDNCMKKVEIINDKKEIKMNLDIINIKYNIKLDKDYFDVNKYINSKERNSNKDKTSTLNEIVYPMYIPVETYLTSQNTVSTDSGERVILNFTGESQFVFVQENLDTNETLGYVYGEPYLILDTIGAITDSSVTWISNGVEYSVMSDTLGIDELLTVAQSIGVKAVGK